MGMKRIESAMARNKSGIFDAGAFSNWFEVPTELCNDFIKTVQDTIPNPVVDMSGGTVSDRTCVRVRCCYRDLPLLVDICKMWEGKVVVLD